MRWPYISRSASATMAHHLVFVLVFLGLNICMAVTKLCLGTVIHSSMLLADALRTVRNVWPGRCNGVLNIAKFYIVLSQASCLWSTRISTREAPRTYTYGVSHGSLCNFGSVTNHVTVAKSRVCHHSIQRCFALRTSRYAVY